MARHVSGLWRAIKVVRRNHVTSNAAFELAFRRLQDYAPISQLHASLISVVHTDRQDRGARAFLYGVMELADPITTGVDPDCYQPRTLRHRLDLSSAGSSGGLSLTECVHLALRIVAALEALHGRGLVHGRIHPSNILYVNGQPKLAEIALVPRHGCVASPDGIKNDSYDPPEGPGTPQSDLYSLGKVLKEARDGRSPQPGAGPEPMQDAPAPSQDVEMEWRRIVRRISQAIPGMRYREANALRKDLERIQQMLRYPRGGEE